MFNMSIIINRKTAKVRTKFDEKNDSGTNNESGKSEPGIQKQKKRILPFRQRQSYCRRKRHIIFKQNFGLKSRIFITAEFILQGESATVTLPESRINSHS